MSKPKIKIIKPDPSTSSGRMVKGIVFTLLLLFYASFLVHPIALPVGDDLPRLIKNGEMVLQGNFEVLTKNVYSYTEPDHAFANHHWLSGVVFYLLDQTVGFDGLVVFKALILLATFTILFLTALKKADFWLVAFFSIPTIFVLRERTFVRPEIFSYLLIAVYLYAIIDLDEHPERSRIFWLIPLQLLWVNLHLFFGVGILMVAGFLFEKIRYYQKDRHNPVLKMLIKRLAILLLLLIAVSFINPFGFKAAIFALQLNIGKDFPIRILETRSFAEFLRDSPIWTDVSMLLFEPMAIILGISFLFSLRKKPIFLFFASLGTAALSFLLLRSLPLFGIIFLIAAAANFSEDFVNLNDWIRKKWGAKERVFQKVLILGYIAGLVYLIFFQVPGNTPKYNNWGIGLKENSTRAAEFFEENGLRGPIFNNADLGSYLIYYFYPKEKVFVDNRFGDAYSASFFSEYLDAVQNEDKWRKIEEKYHFNAIFYFQYDQTFGVRDFLYRRADDPTWALVFADNFNAIYLKRNEQNRELIEKFEITEDNWRDRLKFLLESPEVDKQIAGADVLNLLRREDLVMEIFRKVVSQHPEKGQVWKVMGEMMLYYVDEPDAKLATEYLEKSIAVGNGTADVYGLLGEAYFRTGQKIAAEKALIRALEIDPELSGAKELLTEVKGGPTVEEQKKQKETEEWWQEHQGEQQISN